MNPAHRALALAGAALVIFHAAPLLADARGHHREAITVVSYGGSYARASVRAYHEPFTALTGIPVKLEEFNGELAQIRAQVETGRVLWDVIDMNAGPALAGCDEGLLEEVDYGALPPAPDGAPATEDFGAEHLIDCGVKILAYSTVFAYNENLFPGRKPTKMAHLFDLETFPGRRGLRRSPKGNLEFALVADGVPVAQVYEVLSTPAGLARAFRKLNTIKSEVVWWETGAQSPQLLADGEVVMSTGFNGRFFNAWALEKQPLTVVWDSQLLAVEYLTIVANTPRLEAARRFVAFASSTQSLARLANYIAYGPMRRSAMALVDKQVDVGIPMEPHLPNSPANAANAVREDAQWWADNQDDMNERFATWLLQ